MSEKPRWQKLEHAAALLDSVERKLALYQHQAQRLQTIVDTLTEQETRHQFNLLLSCWQGELPAIKLWRKAGDWERGNFVYCLETKTRTKFVGVDKDGCLFINSHQVTIEDLQREVQS